ncbi:hypothetical protein [uncultured Ruegeria sp.]|uniref:hypothetical protein n=1 Tax=uncultured Ruegeria sp. TaxID=259304 RepID=UPI0026380571|nr:hypothetical protein [uncultured Ruegeria sp.]
MKFFTAITDAFGIIYSKGVYRQVPLYIRGERIYAKSGSGFIRLLQGGGTSAPNTKWYELDLGDGGYEEGRGNVVYLPSVSEAAE